MKRNAILELVLWVTGNWRIDMDPELARSVLTDYLPKPYGKCFCESPFDIKYDLQIIITVYNQAQYLEKCIESVIPFLFSKRKVLIQIIDDGSTDDSGIIADKYGKAFDRQVEVVHQQNLGLSAARNKALETIQGEYLMFIDADDFLPENIDISFLLDSARGKDILQGNWITIDTKDQEIKRISVNKISGFPWGKLYHYTLFSHFKFPEGYWFEDTPITFILCGLDIEKAYIDKSVYCYRTNPESITASLDNPKMVDSYWVTELCLSEFKKFSVEYDQRAYDYFLRQCITNSIRIRKQPRKIRKAVFSLTCELLEKYFMNMHSVKYCWVEDAIRNGKFIGFELIAMIFVFQRRTY